MLFRSSWSGKTIASEERVNESTEVGRGSEEHAAAWLPGKLGEGVQDGGTDLGEGSQGPCTGVGCEKWQNLGFF